LNDYENQIKNLTRERTNLLEEIHKNAVPLIHTTDDEKQTGDKLVKINTKLKRALQTIKDKLHRVATERPDLFTNIGEETNERLDHLISTVEHQGRQIDTLQTERNEIEEQLRSEINDLQK
jgi:predicted  nucleic acid-binding Zn-ribbon protein